MFGWMTRSFERFIGAGDAALTVPVMDGALKPNRAWDEAAAIAAPQVDNLVRRGAGVLFSSGSEIRLLDPLRGEIAPEPVATFAAPVSALAAAPDGTLATALANGEIKIVGGRNDGRVFRNSAELPLQCVTAIAFADEDELIVCVGSQRHPLELWQRDVLESGSSGSVWRLSLSRGEAVKLAEGLAFPYGALVEPGGDSLLVSESWRHRILRLNARRPSDAEVVLDDLPGYPARLSPDVGGGAWLAIFAPRNQLVEFVIREREYRDAMMETIPQPFWIAPALSSRESFLEPLQGGAVRQMGMLKPWAPTRSYGLVIRVDREMQPVASFHSRADGRRHGIASCLRFDNLLIAASKGGGNILLHPLDAR